MEIRAETLYVFDLDGTLLVSHGREIIEHSGMRAGIHPLIESHVSCALPEGRRSDFRYCGEEDAHGDPHDLIETAAVIQPVAEQLREVVTRENAEVAILSARAHDPEWLSKKLAVKLGLERPIRPELIQCVYSRTFEDTVSRGTTPARKAAALDLMVRRCKPRFVHFFDDVQENLDGVQQYFAARLDAPKIEAHHIDFHYALDALDRAQIDANDIFHPQCRDEREHGPNDLVIAIQRTLSNSSFNVLRRLGDSTPPAAVQPRPVHVPP